MWFTVIVLVLSGFYFWLKWNYSYWTKRGIPGPKPTFIVGNIASTLMLKKQFGILTNEWYSEFRDQPYIGFFKNFSPNVVAIDPDLVKNILVKDFNYFNKNEFEFNEMNDQLIANNPFVLSDEKWKSARGTLSVLFTSNKIKSIFPLMVITCDKFKNYITKMGSTADFDSKDLSARFTTQNIVQTTFSIDAECFSDIKSEFRIMGKKLFSPTILQAIKFMVITFLPVISRYFPVSFVPKEVDDWMRNLVKKNTESRKHVKPSHEDILQNLLSIREKNTINDNEVAGHSLSCFIEGSETSSTLLCFALYEMARHQDLQERLYDEIVEVIDKNNGELSFDAVNEMTYLDCVMSETLRLRPVALVLSKVCTKPYEMPLRSGEKTPFVLQPQTAVVIPVYSLHMDPIHYPNPEEFDPERFTAEERSNRHKGVYLAFGEGPRMCMGMKFGLTQTKVALITAVMNFKITVSPNCKPFELDHKYFLYQAKNPLLLNFTPRSL